MKRPSKIKHLARFILPVKYRSLIYRSIPKLYRVNTYLLKRTTIIEPLSPIDPKFFLNGDLNMKIVGWEDADKLRKANNHRGVKSFNRKVANRLNAPEWVGLSLIDKTNGEITYFAWIIIQSIPYFEEFGIKLKSNQFLLKDIFVVPHYRHQGINTRMEQERINYCIRNGANEIFIQIHAENKGGINSVTTNGYELFQQNYVISWSLFNIYRAFKGFLIHPFKRVVK